MDWATGARLALWGFAALACGSCSSEPAAEAGEVCIGTGCINIVEMTLQIEVTEERLRQSTIEVCHNGQCMNRGFYNASLFYLVPVKSPADAGAPDAAAESAAVSTFARVDVSFVAPGRFRIDVRYSVPSADEFREGDTYRVRIVHTPDSNPWIVRALPPFGSEVLADREASPAYSESYHTDSCGRRGTTCRSAVIDMSI